ncbi:hypothetical protein [Noviluteimonas dokdonensis]|nr:hypothetical protein [Lysobacter dokdonensis]
MAAKRFKTTQSAIVEAVEDGAGMGDFGGDYFGIAVGVQISGHGYGVHDNEGDYQIEAYR